MSLKLKITLLLTAWLLIILLLCNVFIYFLVIKITTSSEIELLKDKSRTLILKDLPNHPEYWSRPGPLDEFLIPREMIRYVTKDAVVKYQIYTDKKLLDQPPHYVTKETTKIVHIQQDFFIYVLSPVYVYGDQVATLEIGRSLGQLGAYLDTLIFVLFIAAIGAVILSMIGCYFYTTVVLKPLDHLIETMQTIEHNGVFRLIQLNADEERDELTRLGATFNRMINRLEETFNRQKQFLADASHELRTPITVIDSYASLLRRWASSDSKLREEALDAIQSESAQLKQLTQNLLTLIDSDQEQRMHWVSFDLTPILQSTAASLRLTHSRDIEIRLPKPQGEDTQALFMRGDPEKIKQLLVILLDNALKYSKRAVVVKVAELPRHMEIQVIDQGIGIHPEDLPHLFDRFYRADKARNRKQGGVGLGLAIADNIVRLHEGTITITSKLSKETIVTIKLPKASP